MQRRVLVIIPCFNEREALPALLAELRAIAASSADQLVPLVIDDGSDDATAALARSLGARAVRLGCNLGIGGAVQTGLRVALWEGFDCAVQLDGDGQHPAEELPRLLARFFRADPAGAPDLVIGSRFLEREGFQSTTARRLGIRWLSGLLRLLIRLKVTDPTSGFRVYGRRALQLFDRRFAYDYPEPESIALAHRAGLRVVEEPVAMRARKSGSSSISGLAPAYYMLKVTLAVLLDLVRSERTPPAHHSAGEQPWNPSSDVTGSSPPSAASSPSPSSASSRGNA